ncbi:NLP/P60 family protein [Mycobacterium numidiamassiliense]|uniref:NLP/P60 family protein n=2 Tax=Mycobacterium numidiamassiliense TaxID=1841861 RepID=A0A2U3P5H2_9MYCO|nr:NLP/P60 family protein [Mycobacterium numidiamassiliense]
MVLAALLAAADVFFATAGDVHPFTTAAAAKTVIGDGAPFNLEIVGAASNIRDKGSPDGQPVASRYHTRSRFLPVGVAPEQGLQVRTILAARSISAAFPQIHEIGGVRPDPLPWHPLGLALDVMIPDPGSAQGIALGDAIVKYVLVNANRFGIQDAIWRGVYYTPTGAQTARYGHFDHVHVTTTGGGYPKGGETYLAD